MSKRSKKKALKRATMESNFDVLGSYTGSYLKGEMEEPVQDVDDL